MGARPIRLHDRFWPRVDRNGGLFACWPWLGAVTSTGYGTIALESGTDAPCRGVHRVAFELVVGPIPEGLVLDHLCRRPACCNPSHLEPVTVRENVLRGRSFVAELASRPVCPRCGGEWQRHADRSRGRICKPCASAYNVAYLRRRRKAAA